MVSSGPDVRDEHGFNMCLKMGVLRFCFYCLNA